MEVITRSEASTRGLNRYFTGKPCKHGHLSERNTRSRSCLMCKRQWDDDNHEAKSEYQKKYYAENREKRAEIQRKYYWKNRPAIFAKNKRLREKNRQALLERDRLRRGLPEPTRPAPDNCECCGKPPGKVALNLDHCHETGGFRGWLCSSCNVAIGMLGDNVEGLQRAIDYLRGGGIDPSPY